jgi:hypothetical protein
MNVAHACPPKKLLPEAMLDIEALKVVVKGKA